MHYIGNKLTTIYTTVNTTVQGFWTGWAAGTSLIAGGKMWCVFFDPKESVSGLLGHIGKPSFRRELAIAVAVYSFTQIIFTSLSEWLSINPESLTGKCYRFTARSLSIAGGALAATNIDHSLYHAIEYTAAGFLVAITIQAVIAHRQASSGWLNRIFY